MQLLGQPAKVRQPRRETDHVDAVLRTAVQRDHLVGRQTVRTRDVLQVQAVGAAVGDREGPASRRRLCGSRFRHQLFDPPAQRRCADAQGIVDDHQRTVGRHALDHAFNLCGCHAAIQRLHEPVEARVDRVAELDHQCLIAGLQDAAAGRRCRRAGRAPGPAHRLATARASAVTAVAAVTIARDRVRMDRVCHLMRARRANPGEIRHGEHRSEFRHG